MIQCNEIQQVGNELLIAFEDCKKINNEDLIKLVELILAVNNCSNGGPNYSTLITEVYIPMLDEVVTYPIGTYHAIEIMIQDGSITRTVDGETIEFFATSTLRHELTNVNQTEYTFTVKGGSQVTVEYIIETI